MTVKMKQIHMRISLIRSTSIKIDPMCKQIVVSCTAEWLLRLAHSPISKVLLVQMANTPYVALLNGLKAVSMENVLVNGLSNVPTNEDIQKS